MVSNVNSGYYYQQNPMVYAQHMAVPTHQPSLIDDMKSSLTMAPLIALPNAIGAKNSFYAAQDLVKHKTSLKNLPSAVINGTKGAFGNLTGGNLTDTFQGAKNIFKNHDAIQAATEMQDMIKAAVKAGDTTKVKELQELSSSLMKAAKNGDNAAELISKADNIVAAAKGTQKTGVVSKYITGPIKKLTSKASAKFGETALGKTVQKGLEKAGTTKLGKIASKFGKVAKKSGIVVDLAIEGGIAMFTEVIPAFKNGGVKEGAKQLGKSAVQVGGSVVGFAAGAKGGAALGAAIGSIFPGAGTVIGSAIGGLVGGLLGSSLLSGIAKKITGKNYSEKAAEQEQTQQMQQIQQTQVATNAYGGYDFNVPTNLYPQIATTSYLA